MSRSAAHRHFEARLHPVPQDGGLAAAANAGAGRQRIDKWLWHARVVRSRTDAAGLVESGHVRVNGKRMTAPGQPVRCGDVLTVALDRSVRVLEVAAFSDRRGAAPAARALYRDLTTPSGSEASAPQADPPTAPPSGGG